MISEVVDEENYQGLMKKRKFNCISIFGMFLNHFGTLLVVFFANCEREEQ